MTERNYDIVVFGATSFTGQFVVELLARISETEKVKWCIAGRSMPKLQKVLSVASQHTGKTLEDDIDILMADTSSYKSLEEMASKTRLILNCVGPYRFHGEDAVKACIEYGTHHIDISGEPVFLEKMQLEYHDIAKEKKCYIIGSCGYDSIPAEMGLSFLRKNFEGELNEVEDYIRFDHGPEGTSVAMGTYKSLIHGVSISNLNVVNEIRKKLFKQPLPEPEYKQTKRFPLSYNDTANGWVIPALLRDEDVVVRTQKYFYEEEKLRPIQFKAYQRIPSVFFAFGLAFFGSIFFLLAQFAFGRFLLEKFPSLFTVGFFSKKGPTRKQIEGGSFSMTLIGKGWSKALPITEEHKEAPDESLSVRMLGADAGYVTTPLCMVHAGLCLLKEPENLPHKGGVYTPGMAFEKTSLIERLQAGGMTFKVL